MSRPQFDPSAYAAQLEDKKSRLAGLLAPFAAPAPEVFESPREHYRLRAEFRLWRETGNEKRHYAMFEAGDKHTPILIDEFPIASQRINPVQRAECGAASRCDAFCARRSVCGRSTRRHRVNFSPQLACGLTSRACTPSGPAVPSTRAGPAPKQAPGSGINPDAGRQPTT